MSDDFQPWYSAKLTGWKAALAVAAAIWCLCSGMYTAALLIRRLAE